MIRDLSRDDFTCILHAHLSATAPIQSQEHLFGRTRQLQLIEQALSAPGRTVFIYGDRGVGKTSLAQTVAFSHQAASAEPVLLACTPETTFRGLMTDAISALSKLGPKNAERSLKFKIGFKGAQAEVEHSRKEVRPDVLPPHDLNGIVAALLSTGTERKNETTVVVVDEFDRISDDNERGKFADFIKQIGDQRVPVRFVFCGVAESMQSLLGAHGSCYRYLQGIPLETLGWESRFEIIDAAARALGVTVEDRPRYRIAAISDGFPYYIHRMCEALFWEMFNDPVERTSPTLDNYREAVAQSVLGIEQHLRQSYERAIQKGSPGYEDVLWATADHADLARSTESIYDSYVALFGGGVEDGEVILDRSTVVSRLNALKGPGCGQILTSERKGWYRFRENIMRGYVRLRAEEQGIELALDYAAPSRSNASLQWRKRSARRGRFGTRGRDWEDQT